MEKAKLLKSTLETIATNHQKVGLDDCPNRLGFEAGIGTAMGWIRDSEKSSDFEWSMQELIDEQEEKLENTKKTNVRMCRRGLISAFSVSKELSQKLWV